MHMLWSTYISTHPKTAQSSYYWASPFQYFQGCLPFTLVSGKHLIAFNTKKGSRLVPTKFFSAIALKKLSQVLVLSWSLMYCRGPPLWHMPPVSSGTPANTPMPFRIEDSGAETWTILLRSDGMSGEVSVLHTMRHRRSSRKSDNKDLLP